ncbi:hypothetical protein F1654_08870 [Alkalicaulis satelles]|uniref:Uncharacterized protein n=1 Tax=Alkalicaulis satelles TaxID=2609175 RepID=A0A5M6ZL06_9PROT|nr:hypothetical protein [Alkalicaulis satelles]KAA5803898.1 hypothetical protein F1654_08870 [Alkalicaulis satelles]
MAGRDIHFEVFVKKHRKASWTLAEALHDRDAALKLARELKDKSPQGSVRVVREVWSAEEGAFRGGAIFEAGPERFSASDEKTGEASLPCVTPSDFFGASARDTIRRVLSGWLERRQVCPLELLSRPDLIEDLDGSETDLQHAVQKVAIARAQSSDASVQAYVKLLNALVERATTEARREIKAGKAPPKANSFAELTDKILAEGGPEKRMRRAIADRLADARDISAKTVLLLDMLEDLPAAPEARAFALAQADAFLAEMLSFESAVNALTGPGPDAGAHVERLTGLYEAKPAHPDLASAPDEARRLAARFAARELPDAKGQIASRILSLLRSPKRLRPDSVMREIELSRKLAQRLIMVSGPDLHPDALVEAFTSRSGRLLAPEAVEEALEGCMGPPEAFDRLFAMEDNIVGETNKKKLASYIRARLKTPGVETWFLRGPGQPLERLSRLTQLQARALKGSFPESDKAELVEAFDALGLQILDETKILARVDESGRPALDRAAALLKLAASGVLPLGRCRQDAQGRAMRALSSEMGRTEAASPDARPKLAQIQSLLAGGEAA